MDEPTGAAESPTVNLVVSVRIHGLSLWKLRQFPYLVAKDMGLHLHLKAAIKMQEAHEKALAGQNL